MKKIAYVLIALIVAALFVSGVSAVGEVGGDRGVIEINCDVEGAQVDLYSISGLIETKYIKDGQAEFYYYSVGTPAVRVVVSADGYIEKNVPVSSPSPGEVEVRNVELEMKPIGGTVGFIRAISGLVGANVELLDEAGNVLESGKTDDTGTVEFKVYITADPVKTARLTATGWNTQTQPVIMPSAGDTVNVVFPVQTQAPTVAPSHTQTTAPPAPTKSPMGLAVLGLIGVVGAVALFRRE